MFVQRASSLSCVLATVAILALPAPAAADRESAGSGCVGLDCASSLSSDYVPEAHGVVPAVSGINQLSSQSESGFYEIPAPVYQGNVQPRAVIYLSKPGQFGRMPESVRDLAAVKGIEPTAGSRLDAVTLVIVDSGILYQSGAGLVTAARTGAKVRAAHSWHGCSDLYYCMYSTENWVGLMLTWYGPSYYGTGWWNINDAFWNNQAESMVNHRDGDSLMANLYNGDGDRYCARQQSDDSTFSNNTFNNRASSVALLGSSPDRC
jgi:hypothetical protein